MPDWAPGARLRGLAMSSWRQQQRESVLRFYNFLRQVYEERNGNVSKGPLIFEADVQGYMIDEECANPIENFWDRSGVMVVMEKVISCATTLQPEQYSIDGTCISETSSKECRAVLGLPVSRARQLISFYAMSQNPNMTYLKISNPAPFPPLWVRCDRTDPQQTIWLGAEPFSTGNKLTGITLHTVTCNGPLSNKNISTSLEELKESHRRRHHCSGLRLKGFACYKFLEATLLDSLSLEDTFVPLERNVYADFAWDAVTIILQIPPPTSNATLKFQMACGGHLSSVYEVSRELQFLLGLVKGLKTGMTDWSKPSGGKSAVELVQKLLKDLKDEVDGLKTANNNDIESLQNDTATVYGSVKTVFSNREDLDFVEQLWCKIWKNVASYEELVKCFKLIMKSLQRGELRTWIHQGSNSILSKLIKQSLHGSIEAVPLKGDTPIQMLLEIGVDKMRRDYVSYFVGKELAVHTHLDYFMSTSIDLQEQVHRVQKLHHVLEIVDNCVDLLKLDHENLIFLTQSCIKYYKENPLNDKHVFQLPVRPSTVKDFCQNAYPQIWRVEISSGQGQKKVKTVWQFSTTSPTEHTNASSVGLLDGTEVSDSREEMCFITLAECNQVYFIEEKGAAYLS